MNCLHVLVCSFTNFVSIIFLFYRSLAGDNEMSSTKSVNSLIIVKVKKKTKTKRMKEKIIFALRTD